MALKIRLFVAELLRRAGCLQGAPMQSLLRKGLTPL